MIDPFFNIFTWSGEIHFPDPNLIMWLHSTCTFVMRFARCMCIIELGRKRKNAIISPMQTCLREKAFSKNTVATKVAFKPSIFYNSFFFCGRLYSMHVSSELFLSSSYLILKNDKYRWWMIAFTPSCWFKISQERSADPYLIYKTSNF